MRWNGKPVCPHCGSVGEHYFLTPTMSEHSKAAEPIKIDLDLQDALRALLQVDPDAPPAKPNAVEPAEQDEPVKDQGDALDG